MLASAASLAFMPPLCACSPNQSVVPAHAIPCSYQRSRQGPYSEGDAVPAGINLLEMPRMPAAAGNAARPEQQQWQQQHRKVLPHSCRSTSLERLAAGPRPLVLLAGSWS